MGMVANMCIPANLIVLGMNLAQGTSFRKVPIATNIGILVTRMLLVPLALSSLMYLAIWHTPIAMPRAAWLLCLVVTCTPTANNILAMMEAGGQDTRALEVCIYTQQIFFPIVLL